MLYKVHYTLLLPLFAWIFIQSAPNINAQNQGRVVSFSEIDSLLHNSHDTLYVINFWATWCKPCVEELPLFEEINEIYAHQPVKVLLSSLDFIQDKEKVLLPFIKKKNILSEIVLLKAENPNEWIDKVDMVWSGALPATLLINNQKKIRKFFEKQFKHEELQDIVTQLLKSEL
jgi:thiol-disulfide isomerase/thioredoxin